MKEYKPEQIRNIGIISHADAGKTSLVEAMLYNAGAIEALGSVDEGNTVADYNEEEINRKITINASVCIAEWNGCKFNIIDTPGMEDFYGEVESALRVVDAVICLVNANMGVEGGTEKVWEIADKYNLPRLIFVNRMDEEGADFDKALNSIQEILEAKTVPIQLPIGEKDDFSGTVNVKSMKAFDSEGNETEIPDSLKDRVQEYREDLIEMSAEGEDELIEKYLMEEELTDEEISRGFKVGFMENQLVPVLCGSAYQNIGVEALMDFVNSIFPSPQDAGPIITEDGMELEPLPDSPMSALVFKTMADPYYGRLNLFRVYSGILKADSQILNATKGSNERIGKISMIHGKELTDISEVTTGDLGAVIKLSTTNTGDTLCSPGNKLVLPGIEFSKPVISLAVDTIGKADDEKLSSTLMRLSEEDPTFVVERNTDTKQLLISGLGEMHLNTMLARLKSKFGVDAITETPKVAYKETIRKSVREVSYRHKKQTGGRGQFGEVHIHLEPLSRGEGFEFVDEIKGGVIPQNFIPAVESGIRSAMEEGIVAGYPVVDVKVTLFYGKHHPVDSSDIAFQTAASMAFKEAMRQGGPVLLEPIMNIEISVPGKFMGDVIGDLNSKRGRVMNVEQSNSRQHIKARAPLAEVFRYAIDLKSMTSARGSFSMEFSHYEEVPDDVAKRIIESAKASED